MKTIFITLFEGVEAKNILRTDIVPTLLKDSEARLVLLMKSAERINLYKKEFNNPRIIYEVVPYVRSRGRGFDRVFGALKYTLLKTKTTELQRRLEKEANGNYLAYGTGKIANRILARPMVRKIVRVLDFLLVRNTLYTEVFERYKPDLVFLAHLFEEPEIHILREAKRRKIKSIGFINSWDKVTERCIMRLLPDKAVVFNDIVRNDLMKHNDMDKNDIFVGGLPHYDQYMKGSFLKREEFFERIECNPQKKLLVYASNISAFSHSDWQMIDLLHELNSKGAFGEEINILVRFRPNDFIEEQELKKRPHLRYDYPGTRFSLKRGIDWDMDEAEEAHLRNTLRWMDLLACYSSSLTVDAVMFDKPIVNINFEATEPGSASKLPMRFYNYNKEHYAKALESGGVRLVHSEGELVQWVKRYLENPAEDAKGRERLRREQCQFLDGRSGERIGKFILANL